MSIPNIMNLKVKTIQLTFEIWLFVNYISVNKDFEIDLSGKYGEDFQIFSNTIQLKSSEILGKGADYIKD